MLNVSGEWGDLKQQGAFRFATGSCRANLKRFSSGDQPRDRSPSGGMSEGLPLNWSYPHSILHEVRTDEVAASALSALRSASGQVGVAWE